MSRSTDPQKREWQRRLRRFTRTKSTIAKFCANEGVSVPSFYQWRRKLADAPKVARSAKPSFVPVQVVGTGGGVKVVFPNGARLTLPTHDGDLVRIAIESIANSHTNLGDA